MGVLNSNDVEKACAIYLRKSRKDKDIEDAGGDTLARHEKILTDLAKKQGLAIGEIYREVVSGDSIEARPEMQRLLEDVHNNKWNGVLVVELERLARGDTKDQGIVAEAFKFSETLIITPSKTFDPNNEFDEEYFEFGLFMSRREYKTIKRRLNAGVKLSVLEGNYLGSFPPFGYDIDDRGRRDRTLKPNKDADVLKMMFHWYAVDNVSFCEIASRLTEMNIPTVRKLPYWSVKSVKFVLENDVYIGKVRHGRFKYVKEYDPKTGGFRKVRKECEDMVIADGKHTPLVDAELWQAAQDRMAKNPRVKYGRTLNNALAGLLVCKDCGRTLRLKTQRTGGKEYKHFRHATDSICVCRPARYEDVIDDVIAALNMYIADFTVKVESGNAEDAQNHARMIEEMENHFDALKGKRKKLMTLFEDDIYTEEEFLERKKDINDEMTLLSARIEEAKREQPAAIDYAEKLVKFSDCVKSLNDPNTAPKDANALLKTIICKIEYTRKDRQKPYSLDITLV